MNVRKDDLNENFMMCLSEVNNTLHFVLDYIAMMQSSILKDNGEYDFFSEEQRVKLWEQRVKLCETICDSLDDLDDIMIEAYQTSTNISRSEK
jgi:hypothetical protein